MDKNVKIICNKKVKEDKSKDGKEDIYFADLFTITYVGLETKKK